jgi:hypothetical protein
MTERAFGSGVIADHPHKRERSIVNKPVSKTDEEMRTIEDLRQSRYKLKKLY